MVVRRACCNGAGAVVGIETSERFGKKLRRRATHQRLFDNLAELKQSIRANLSYCQTVRKKVKSLLEPRPKRKTK